MVTSAYEDLREYELQYDLIPVAKEMLADNITPILLMKKIAARYEKYYLLESVENSERWGRYSFLGFQPLLHVTAKNHKVLIQGEGTFITLEKENPMDILREILKKNRVPSIPYLPSFLGGFVGYFSYEMYGYKEKTLKLRESDFCDLDVMMFDKVIAFDHLRQTLMIIANYKSKEGKEGYEKALKEIEDIIHFIIEEMNVTQEQIEEKPEFTCNLSKEEFINMVDKVKEHIKEGDIFQAVVSRRFESEYKGSLLNTYRILRTTNPSPYMYYIHTDKIEIAGASPETLIKLEHKKLTTFPVAGTRKRGKDEIEDMALMKELLEDEKELAEHNMLVDLARNDIGQIAEFGTVKVEEYQKIHRFSKVMHITSKVTGMLKEGYDGCDAISTLLPAGTLSGAPKIKACQIIDSLEPVPRGIYGGAIGYLDFSGNVDVCIAIRTAIKKDNKVYVQAGAGIVSDSVPIKEYEECENKASAIMNAVYRAQEVDG